MVAEASLTGESQAVLKNASTLTGPVALGDRFDTGLRSGMRGEPFGRYLGRRCGSELGRRPPAARVADRTLHDPPAPRPVPRSTLEVSEHYQEV